MRKHDTWLGLLPLVATLQSLTAIFLESWCNGSAILRRLTDVIINSVPLSFFHSVFFIAGTSAALKALAGFHGLN